MRLAIVTHKVIKGDGQGRVNYEVAQEAIRRGHDVTLLASQVEKELEQSEQINWIKITVKNIPTEFLRNLIFSQQSKRWLQKHYQELDVVKANGAITSFPSDINAVHFAHNSWLKSPLHTWQQRKNVYGLYQWLYSVFNAHWEKRAFNKAKIVVAICQQIRQELIAMNIPDRKIRTITNGVDLEEFFPGKSARSKYNLPQDVPLAFFAGDIRTSRKNLDTVLQALAKVPQLHLAVAGNLENSPYPSLAARLELSSRVHFLGYRRDIPEIIRATDFLVFPSRYEPFGLIVLEAMASGIPVITAATAGVAELVTLDCGFVLEEPDDVAALTEYLAILSNNADKRQRMGKNAREIAVGHSWQAMASTYINIFEELIQSC